MSDVETKKQKLNFQQIHLLCSCVQQLRAGSFKTWNEATVFLSDKLDFSVSQSSIQNAMLAVGRDPKELLATSESVMALYDSRISVLEEKVAQLTETVNTLGRLLERSIAMLHPSAVPPASGEPITFVADGTSSVKANATIQLLGPAEDRVGGIDVNSSDLDVD